VRRQRLLRIAGRAVADLERMGIRGGGRRDPSRRPRRPGLARAHPRLVFAFVEGRAAAGRPAGAECLRRAGPARAGLGMDRRRRLAAGRRRQPQPGRPRHRQVLRRRRAVDGRPRQLRGADAGGDAVLAGRPRRHRQHGIPLRQERAMKPLSKPASMKRALPGLAVAALLCLAGLAGAAGPAQPLPGDSVYQLALPLTDQDGRTADWRALRGKPRLVAMFYTSCQYICPLIVESGKAVERQLSDAERQRLGVLLVSMDPARDDPAALRKVVEQRKLDTARWTLASPPQAKVRDVAGLLGIRYRQLA